MPRNSFVLFSVPFQGTRPGTRGTSSVNLGSGFVTFFLSWSGSDFRYLQFLKFDPVFVRSLVRSAAFSVSRQFLRGTSVLINLKVVPFSPAEGDQFDVAKMEKLGETGDVSTPSFAESWAGLQR